MLRRTFITALGAGSAAATWTQVGAMAPPAIAQRAACRVIVDNDFAGDPDGLVALAHQLLSPKARTVLITASALDAKLAAMAGQPAGRTAAAGARLASELVVMLGLARPPAVLTGAERFGAGPAQMSPAAHAIVAEAMRDDALPLFVTCGGPLTNVAAALRLEPAIAGRLTLIWIGGSDRDGEYNVATDPAAARYVVEQTAVPLWQIAAEEYRKFQVSVAELGADFAGISPVSRWLYGQYGQLPPFVHLGGSLTFGDSLMVSLTTFGAEVTPYRTEAARRILGDGSAGVPLVGRTVRRYHGFDQRLNLADLLALLRLHQPPQPPP